LKHHPAAELKKAGVDVEALVRTRANEEGPLASSLSPLEKEKAKF
jgi:hypothetical protein